MMVLGIGTQVDPWKYGERSPLKNLVNTNYICNS
jgi:hypothetical protein